MSKHYQVEQIIEFLKEKIANLKAKITEHESPIMADMTKNSPHLQYDYVRLKAELQSNEDILLAIDKFTDKPGAKTAKDGTEKNRQNRKG